MRRARRRARGRGGRRAPSGAARQIRRAQRSAAQEPSSTNRARRTRRGAPRPPSAGRRRDARAPRGTPGRAPARARRAVRGRTPLPTVRRPRGPRARDEVARGRRGWRWLRRRRGRRRPAAAAPSFQCRGTRRRRARRARRARPRQRALRARRVARSRPATPAHGAAPRRRRPNARRRSRRQPLHDCVRDGAQRTDTEEIVRRIREDAVDDARDRRPLRRAEPQTVLERRNRRRVGDEVAGELDLLHEAPLLEREVYLEDARLDARRAGERQLLAQDAHVGPRARLALCQRGDRLLLERRERRVLERDAVLLREGLAHERREVVEGKGLADLLAQRRPGFEREEVGLDDAALVPAVEELRHGAERTIDGEDHLEDEAPFVVGLERERRDRAAAHGDEVATGIEDRKSERFQRPQETAHAPVRDLGGRQRERLLGDERRAVRQEERHAEVAFAESERSSARHATDERLAGVGRRRRCQVPAARGEDVAWKAVDSQHPGTRSQRLTQGREKMPVRREPDRRRDVFGALLHREFLADGRDDPRRAFAESLLDATRDTAHPILVYSDFESDVLAELALALPDLAADLEALRARLRDLLIVVRDHVYDPRFRGSFSLKAVAPATIDRTAQWLLRVDRPCGR
ncbi:MAG: DUF2779 domain-containing protein [Deltaproteobacteria bacterium]|nr:MAG: DUF2779 domain-containing protein [Deltaproteobacteria bacterium]